MFFSKRNQVYPVLLPTGIGVQKHFADPGDWDRECAIHRQLRDWSGCARVLDTAPQVITTQWYPGPTLLEELLRQEQEGFQEAPWLALAQWLQECQERCGSLPEDGNLRNFLWSDGRIIGIDLESYTPQSMETCAADIIGRLSLYDPPGTAVKDRACALLQHQLQVSEDQIRIAKCKILQRRASLPQRAVSGIILAGGRSSRMGCDKSQLTLGTETLLQRQIRKLHALGITDILISGPHQEPGTRSVADIYPGRGPLGGLHACLAAAANPVCLVLSVDVPLVPVSILDRLCRAHRAGITVLSHNGLEEPLIGVYDRDLAASIEPLIAQRGVSVRHLAGLTHWSAFPYHGPDSYLCNCNTPEDYQTIRNQLESFSRRGLEFL